MSKRLKVPRAHMDEWDDASDAKKAQWLREEQGIQHVGWWIVGIFLALCIGGMVLASMNLHDNPNGTDNTEIGP